MLAVLRLRINVSLAARWGNRLVRHVKALLSLAATKEHVRLHLQFPVFEERRHPLSDIFSNGLPCGAGES